jgi:hypothetical protein
LFCGTPESYVYSALRSVNMEQTNIDLNKIVGANLKRAIKKSKWRTQEKFSEAFGAEVRTVGRWCNQGIDKLSLVQQIADFLEIDVFALLSR